MTTRLQTRRTSIAQPTASQLTISMTRRKRRPIIMTMVSIKNVRRKMIIKMSLIIAPFVSLLRIVMRLNRARRIIRPQTIPA